MYEQKTMKLENLPADIQDGTLVLDGPERPASFPVLVTSSDQSSRSIEVTLKGNIGNSWNALEGCEARLILGKEQFRLRIVDTSCLPTLRLKEFHPRSQVRVDAYLPVIVKKLSSENLSHWPEIYLKSGWGFGRETVADDFLRKSINQYNNKESDSSNLYQIFTEINVKLNIILSFLCSDESKELFLSKPRKINLSGSGMAFWSDQSFDPGDYVGVRMVLPLFPMAMIGFVASVVSVSRPDKVQQDESAYRISMKFYEIADGSREQIIQYVFQRQREILRGRTE